MDNLNKKRDVSPAKRTGNTRYGLTSKKKRRYWFNATEEWEMYDKEKGGSPLNAFREATNEPPRAHPGNWQARPRTPRQLEFLLQYRRRPLRPWSADFDLDEVQGLDG
jgi:hypothetical protein